ncbi:MAG: hypothetical protein HDT28_04725 [Clostridiales bacterium]|nr:hypothetical protein [Clostridiales bacterium]
MKKIMKSLIAAAVAVCCIAPLAACDANSDMLTTAPNVGISSGVAESVKHHSEVAYYELERPDDVRITFETEKIQKVSFKYRVLESKEYTFKNDVLIIDKSVFANETAGDKRIRVFVDNSYTEISVRVVSKVIYTVEDFNSIRSNLNGVFVLGADIDFANQMFFPIGKPVTSADSTGTFEGVFDGMGYSVKNITVQARDWAEGEDGVGQGPSLGGQQGNGRNYNNGIFMSTGGSAQIINTNFSNITVNGQGLVAAVVGANGGLIKNCSVTCSLSHGGYFEHSAGIAGVNGSGDAAGRIENCIVVYSSSGGSRGIADWNNGIIKNCYAAVADDYVLHVGYDKETGRVPADFDYDDYINERIEYYAANPTYAENPRNEGKYKLENGEYVEADKNEEGNYTGQYDRTLGFELFFGNYTIPAFPGAMDTSQGIFYKAGDIINSDVVRKEFLLDPDNFPVEDGWDRDVWTFAYGSFPTLKIQSR